MSRLSGLLALAAALALAGPLAAQPAADLGALFRRGDADGDGKLSRDEFLKMAARWPRLKDAPGRAGKLFDRLDADGDGFLTPAEFKKIAAFRPKGDAPAAKPDAPPAPAPAPPAPDKLPTAEGTAFFEKSVRPVLVAHCYKCHSAESEKVKGGLALDTREGTRKGGDTGPAVVPGDPKRSLLIRAVRYHDDALKMPPKARLPDAAVADLETWVRMGAPDPRGGAAKAARAEVDLEKARQFWAFQPPKKAAPPAVADAAWPRTDADRFLLAALEARGLKPVADADRPTLLRRVTFDLTGLPPTPDELAAFLADSSPRAFETVVDRLLASRQFGERWGRHWLDVARYAESSGKQANFAYPNAWRYRDYVIAAFQADKPYDQFLREQLAGDLLPARDDRHRAELLTATGFLAVGAKSHNERVPLQFQLDLADEQIDATFTAFQGLTVACARCHDHKFDPITQRDYYALAGIFRSTETCYGTVRTVQSNFPSPLLSLPRGAGVPSRVAPLTAARRAEMESQLKEQRAGLAKLSPVDRMASMAGVRLRVLATNLESRLALYDADGTPKAQAMGVRERPAPADSALFARGEIEHPGEAVRRGVPRVLAAAAPTVGKGSGRLELADWLVSRDNPLTARVMVNRVWLHLFGRGLVPTPDNFGASGQPPGNAALLDSLACAFADGGWSVKSLVRTLVLSRAYGLSSAFDAADYEADPDNTLVWRMNRRRVEAEALRDAMLACAGALDPNPPATEPFAANGEGFVNLTLRTRPVDSFTAEPYRSVYLPILRDQLPEALALFDFPDPTLPAGERAVTTIPGQSLYLMNNPFVLKQAGALARNLLAAPGGDAERLGRAYRVCFSRPPSDAERARGLEFLEKYAERLAADGKKGPEARRASWAALCGSLFASAEFSHR